MITKIVTAYWMNAEGYPYQGTRESIKTRYLGSLISHCRGIDFPIVCYTHERNREELYNLKSTYNLENLEIKILELCDMKYHKEISRVRDIKFDTDLSGRGPEIMWGKFQAVEQELDGCERVYWVDCGLQHPGIFPWMYCVPYGDKKFHTNITRPAWADCEITQYNFTHLFNTKIFNKLNTICEDKLATICSTSPQIGYPFAENGIDTLPITTPYPVGGVIGGSVSKFKEYINTFWSVCEQVLNKNILCTEEAIMKVVHDIHSSFMLPFTFGAYQTNEHDQYHFELWDNSWNKPKPLYMVWHDINQI